MTKDIIKETRTYLKRNILNLEKFVGYESERQQVYDLLKRTIDTGESNSALLIGPREVGKTALVNDVICELKSIKSFDSNAVLVMLHGLVHTDDRLALKSATTQMNLDNAVDGKVFGSFAENLAFLLACLKSGEKHTSKSVIFILEEFDLFCNHHNQTLLYNLFDVSQSAQTPICILGITCRLDVVELLEKRVKSRFSHRQIFLFPGKKDDSISEALENRISRVRYYLSLPENKDCVLPISHKKQWNKSIKILTEDKKFRNLMQWLLDVDTSEHTLKNILFVVVSSLNEKKPSLTVADFEEQLKELDKDEVVQVLQDLSVLELCLIIAMKHHVEIYDNQAMNFEMVFNRYVKFASANSNVQTVQRPVVLKAFEHLKNMELISVVNQGIGKLQKEYQLFKLLVTPHQIKEAVDKYSGLPTEVTQWANSSLI